MDKELDVAECLLEEIDEKYLGKFSLSIRTLSNGTTCFSDEGNVPHCLEKFKDNLTGKKILTMLPGCSHLQGKALIRRAERILVSFESYFTLALAVISDIEENEESVYLKEFVKSTIGMCLHNGEIFSFRTIKDPKDNKWYMNCDKADLNDSYSLKNYLFLIVKK